MMTDKKDYGSGYICPNGCLGSEVPGICRFCKEPMKEFKFLSPPMEIATLSIDIFEDDEE